MISKELPAFQSCVGKREMEIWLAFLAVDSSPHTTTVDVLIGWPQQSSQDC